MAASLKTPKHYRAWENKDSFEQSDVVRLFDTEKVKTTKTVHFSKYFTVYATFIGFFVLFLLGILVGLLLRDDPKVATVCSTKYRREDGFDREKLQAIHNNIVYYMSGDSIRDHNSELSALVRSSSPGNVERFSAEYVAGEFRKLGVDRVDVEQHDIVVTSPDPDHPNRLAILSPDGSTTRNLTLNKGNKSGQLFDFSPSGKVKGAVVYGNYGRYRDFTRIRKLQTDFNGSIALLKIGWNSILNKVRLAARFGCSAVLLFCGVDEPCCHGNLCDDDDVPDVSYSELSELHSSDAPSIPVQTVSHSVAMQLLSTENQSIYQNGSQDSTDIVNNTGRTFVQLEVYTKQVVQTIYNVVATIYGAHEPDRVVMVGAHRNVWNPTPNTGILLELARSMTYIRQREMWKPRRTVRFVSLGSIEPHARLHQYIQSKKHIYQQEGVAFIDLDLGQESHKVTEVKSDVTLHNLTRKAYNMVPDPLNPEISLAENWPSIFHDPDSANQSGGSIFTLDKYSSLHELGVATISVQSLPVRDYELTENLRTRETIDDTVYDLAVGRVVSLATLKLLDDPILPFNISLFTQVLDHSLYKSVNRLKQNYPGIHTYDAILSKAKQLSAMVTRLESTRRSMKDCFNIRPYNDLLMRFENIFFIERSKESNGGVLDIQTGSLPTVLDTVDWYLSSENENTVRHLLDWTGSRLQEAIQEIESLNK